jgi:hypothetical protein
MGSPEFLENHDNLDYSALYYNFFGHFLSFFNSNRQVCTCFDCHGHVVLAFITTFELDFVRAILKSSQACFLLNLTREALVQLSPVASAKKHKILEHTKLKPHSPKIHPWHTHSPSSNQPADTHPVAWTHPYCSTCQWGAQRHGIRKAPKTTTENESAQPVNFLQCPLLAFQFRPIYPLHQQLVLKYD